MWRHPGLSATLASELQAVGAAAGRDLAPAPDRVLQRAAVLAVALGPPLAISLAHPGSFLTVLQVRRVCKAGDQVLRRCACGPANVPSDQWAVLLR